jgi:heterodisulfide reductase subunit A-like polyferredoxin/coenzyme F420-reducing hydrogenase delta subunit
MSDIKVGVYFCTCEGELEKAIALDSLAQEASGRPGVAVVRKDPSLCSERGIGAIREDVKKLGLDRVLIAACSPSLKTKEFADLGINKYLVERVNIREQCSRSHAGNPSNATKKARAILGMSLEKIRHSKALEPVTIPAVKTALVVGGGVAGINAALDIAGTGAEVFLIEKKPFLGGKVSELHRYYPRLCPPSCGLELMFSRLESDPRIHVLTSSEIESFSGSPGNFSVSIMTSSSDAIKSPEKNQHRTIIAGAVILATGWEPFDPTPLTEYGYGRLEQVITNLDFEKRSREQKQFLDQSKKTAFIQCVGSRDERHLPYCSDVCCMVSIKQALLLKEADPDNEVYIFYNDIRTPGEYEDMYRQARTSGIKFIKGIPSEVRQDGQGKIGVSVFDTIAGERTEVAVDLVVLATGMKASRGTTELKNTIGLVTNKYNFIESHLQCHPLDSQREGMFTAGCCRAPMDVSRSIESAGAAAAKALRYLQDEITVSPDYPVVDILKCDRCKRCMEECPSKAYSFDEKGFPKVDSLKCRVCGICMGSCPLGAISLGELSIEQLSGMLDVLDKSYLGDDEPVILGFLCKNDAYRAADDAGLKGIRYPSNMISIMVPCSGAVNSMIVSEAISKGVDGVLIAGCPDSQCHYIQGSALAKTRLADVSNKLKDMYIEPERVRFASISRDEPEKFAETIKEYVEELKKLGKNPLRII